MYIGKNYEIQANYSRTSDFPIEWYLVHFPAGKIVQIFINLGIERRKSSFHVNLGQKLLRAKNSLKSNDLEISSNYTNKSVPGPLP